MSAAAPRHLLVGVLAFVLHAGCGPKPTIHHGASSTLGAAPLAPCPALPTGAEPLVQPGATVVLGGLHGTEESPAFAATLACDAAQRGSVIVGLEVAAELTPALRAYIASEGDDADREALLDHEFWAGQDGRASQAMLSLIDNLRELRRRGRIVDVFAYDGGYRRSEQNGRDVFMAKKIAATLQADPDDNRVALILTGSQHAQNDSDRWMAWHLRTVFSDLITLRYSFRGGTAWTCAEGAETCGRIDLPGRPSEGSRSFVELADIDNGKWHGRFYLARATASPPLKKSNDSVDMPAGPDEARARAMAAYRAEEYAACRDLFGIAAENTPGREAVDDYYGAARCAARAGDADGAFDALDRAVARGLRALQDVKVDADLAPLHTDPRWQRVLGGVRTNEAEFAANNNGELLRIFRATRAERAAAPREAAGVVTDQALMARDERRRARVREILAAGGARTSADYYHAAAVFQHSLAPADYLKAHDLAVKAVNLNPRNDEAKWLAAAAEDRFLMSQGKPQKYGTQFKKIDGVWQVWKVDPSITDQERARWNVRPLEAAKRVAAEMNRAPSGS